MSCTVEPTIHSSDTGQQIRLVDSCQLTITWMSIIKFNTESIMPWTLSGRPWTTMTSTRLWRPAVLVKTRVYLARVLSLASS